MPRASPATGPSRQLPVRWPRGLLEAVEAQARAEERTTSDMLKILVGLGLIARTRPAPRRP